MLRAGKWQWKQVSFKFLFKCRQCHWWRHFWRKTVPGFCRRNTDCLHEFQAASRAHILCNKIRSAPGGDRRNLRRRRFSRKKLRLLRFCEQPTEGKTCVQLAYTTRAVVCLVCSCRPVCVAFQATHSVSSLIWRIDRQLLTILSVVCARLARTPSRRRLATSTR